MINKYFIIILFSFSIRSQIAPDYKPYSLLSPQMSYYDNVIIYKSEKINLEFSNLNKNIVEDLGFIYRIIIKNDIVNSGYLNMAEFNIPDGAMLFIFGRNNSYTGPYIKSLGQEFISGRFFGNDIVLEYFLPKSADYEGNIIFSLIDYKKEYIPSPIPDKYFSKISHKRERSKILVTGYWPPTNEMVRHFSQDEELNPDGWEGENWEGLGYDVVSYFPEFDPPNCNSCGQGFGDLEVDYQDFSEDFWPIVNEIKPVGIITFSRGYNDMSWELENRLVNRTNWYNDYTAPLLPTPNPPDDSVGNYYVRYTSLPIDEIMSAIFDSHLGLDAYLDNTNAGMFLSEFAGYHGVWYKESNEINKSEMPCYSAGHIHVGSQIEWNTAKQAAEISIRTLINYIDQQIVLDGDCNSDGDVNILDIIALVGSILGEISLSQQEEFAADMDGNGMLNILDIVAIVELIINN